MLCPSLHTLAVLQWGTGYWTTVGDCKPWKKQDEEAYGATAHAENSASSEGAASAIAEKLPHLKYLVRYRFAVCR
jgi:hypothetical protein